MLNTRSNKSRYNSWCGLFAAGSGVVGAAVTGTYYLANKAGQTLASLPGQLIDTFSNSTISVGSQNITVGGTIPFPPESNLPPYEFSTPIVTPDVSFYVRKLVGENLLNVMQKVPEYLNEAGKDFVYIQAGVLLAVVVGGGISIWYSCKQKRKCDDLSKKYDDLTAEVNQLKKMLEAKNEDSPVSSVNTPPPSPVSVRIDKGVVAFMDRKPNNTAGYQQLVESKVDSNLSGIDSKHSEPQPASPSRLVLGSSGS